MCQIIYISAQNPDSDDYSGHLWAMGAPPKKNALQGRSQKFVLGRYKRFGEV